MTETNSAKVLNGRCHCGNLSVRLFATKPASALPARLCGCTFCRPRHMRWTSDPGGHVEIAAADATQLSRYRFGTGTADFLICRRCGYLMAALSEGEPARAVINIDVLDQAHAFGAAQTADFDAEGVDDRLARRARTWTPARLLVSE